MLDGLQKSFREIFHKPQASVLGEKRAVDWEPWMAGNVVKNMAWNGKIIYKSSILVIVLALIALVLAGGAAVVTVAVALLPKCFDSCALPRRNFELGCWCSPELDSPVPPCNSFNIISHLQ